MGLLGGQKGCYGEMRPPLEWFAGDYRKQVCIAIISHGILHTQQTLSSHFVFRRLFHCS